MKKIIKSEQLRYFIFDTGVTGTDVDFVQYNWSRKRYNKVREGDYFIYRRPTTVSENKKFYFFGVGRVGKITGPDDDVTCTIEDPVRFKNIVYQDDISDYVWEWKTKKRDDFQQFFNNYGMNKIPFEDLEYFFKKGMGNINVESFEQENIELVNSHIKLLKVDENNIGKKYLTTSRGSIGKIFSDNVRTIYNNRCCVTGISTRSMLESSHISPWSDDKENRGNEKNGLLLSLIFHKCFDKGLISIDDNYKLIVSKNIKDDNLKDYLNQFKNQKISLPVRKEYRPDKELLKKHREKFGFEKSMKFNF